MAGANKSAKAGPEPDPTNSNLDNRLGPEELVSMAERVRYREETSAMKIKYKYVSH